MFCFDIQRRNTHSATTPEFYIKNHLLAHNSSLDCCSETITSSVTETWHIWDLGYWAQCSGKEPPNSIFQVKEIIPWQRLLTCYLYAGYQTHIQNPQLLELCLLVNNMESLRLYEGPVSLKLATHWNHLGALKTQMSGSHPQRFNNWTGVRPGHQDW